MRTIRLETCALQCDESHLARTLDHRAYEARLADPRFARHEQRAAVRGTRAIERVGDGGQRSVPADEDGADGGESGAVAGIGAQASTP